MRARDSFNGRTSVFQTEDRGSIPLSRTVSMARLCGIALCRGIVRRRLEGRKYVPPVGGTVRRGRENFCLSGRKLFVADPPIPHSTCISRENNFSGRRESNSVILLPKQAYYRYTTPRPNDSSMKIKKA